MSDMLRTIVPKSNQLNADDLLGGRTMTITITGVNVKAATEQPVSLNYEGDNGKPYKPCKSMCRVLVHAWGSDSKAYVGRSLTLYCDPKVTWAGIEVGGIRISHMSHIGKELSIALTASKGNRKPYTVQPLPGTWTTPAAQQTEQPKRDYAAEIMASATIEALGKVWTSIPAKEQKALTALKDQRKTELTPTRTDAQVHADTAEAAIQYMLAADIAEQVYRELECDDMDLRNNWPQYRDRVATAIRIYGEQSGEVQPPKSKRGKGQQTLTGDIDTSAQSQ